uniref:Col_cuticle_N domain-containing protein n=1 Tax=Mesocestoides corti TaxID=53468 RepID=A0A5K3FCX1_MESCO
MLARRGVFGVVVVVVVLCVLIVAVVGAPIVDTNVTESMFNVTSTDASTTASLVNVSMDELTTTWNYTTSTEVPEIIVFVNEKNPSDPPNLNVTSTTKDLNEKLNKAERVGAIVGCVLAIFIIIAIVAIYLLYRKSHQESTHF